MANSAPRASRSASGDVLPNWDVRVTYNTEDDLLYCTVARSDLFGAWARSKARTFHPDDVEGCIAWLNVQMRTHSARRLF